MAETGVVLVRQGTALPSPQQWQAMLDMADAMLRTGLLPSTIKTPQAAVVLILKGGELGIPPMQALSQIVVVNGKPSLQSELMAALIYRDHGDDALMFDETSAERCVVSYKRRAWKERRTFAFSLEDAKRAELLTNATWKKYPAAMLRARCISAVARMAFADSIGGMHTPEELGARVAVRDGEVVAEGEVVGEAPPADQSGQGEETAQRLRAELERLVAKHPQFASVASVRDSSLMRAVEKLQYWDLLQQPPRWVSEAAELLERYGAAVLPTAEPEIERCRAVVVVGQRLFPDTVKGLAKAMTSAEVIDSVEKLYDAAVQTYPSLFRDESPAVTPPAGPPAAPALVAAGAGPAPVIDDTPF